MLLLFLALRRTGAALAVGAVVATSALAAPPDRSPATSNEGTAEQLAQRAKDAFKARDFEVAAKLFMQAYAKSHSAALVFNAARAYEEAGKPGDATSLFKLYVTIAEDPDGIADARDRIRRLQASADRASVPASSDAGGQAPAVESGTVVESKSPEIKANAASDRTMAWTVTGAAGLSLVSGALLMVAARADAHAANGLAIRDDASIRDYNDRFDSAQRNWAVGVGLAAVGVGLGAWASWLHLHANPTPAARVSWTIETGPTVARLTVQF